jgi:N-acetyl-anhydromuramyl-L-alanine amidase AmpD
LKTEIIGLQGQRISKEQAAVRRISPDRAQVYGKIVERYAMLFDRPEVRLRFLNNMIAKQVIRQKKLQHALRHFSFIQRTRLYDLLLEVRFYRSIMEELSASAGAVPIHRSKYFRNIRIPLTARTGFFCYQFRHVLYGAGVMVALLMAFGLYSFGSWSFGGVNNILAEVYGSGRPVDVGKAVAMVQPSQPVEEEKQIAKFEKVFFLEKKGNEEKWSNRARIRTEYEVNHRPRRYYVIPRGSDTPSDQARSDIVGIVYHTTESHIVPYDPDYSQDVVKSSRGVINYVRNNRLYHYLIDRSGDIYRIVRDEYRASHSGDSIWADSRNTYVGLNDSFIGVAFESSMNAASPKEILTKEQILSGKELTDVLRTKYNIADENCTTHGLVSIHPQRMLIAFHHDWVRDFPFAEMGLSDKYKVPPPSMSEFGFSTDDEILAKLDGKLWEGAIIAQRQFQERADRANIDPQILREKMRDRYIAQIYNRAPIEDIDNIEQPQVKPSGPSFIARSSTRKVLVRSSRSKPKPGRSRR